MGKFFVGVLIVFLGLVLYGNLFPNRGPVDTSTRMEKTQTGCRNLDDLLRLKRLAADRDEKAYFRLHGELLAAGRCKILPQGSVVYIDDTSTRNSASAVRIHGETIAWWTDWVHP